MRAVPGGGVHLSLYSLAFLYQTGGVLADAIKRITNKAGILVYGISVAWWEKFYSEPARVRDRELFS